MSRKGNCLDNAATEQVFGHLKDEFYRGRESSTRTNSSNANWTPTSSIGTPDGARYDSRDTPPEEFRSMSRGLGLYPN